MKKENTALRLRHIMEERNLKQADILELAKPYCEKYSVKLGRNDLSQYISGKVEPGQSKLTILSLALHVSETWLMGYDVPTEINMSKEDKEKFQLSEEEKELVTLFRELHPASKKTVLDLIKLQSTPIVQNEEAEMKVKKSIEHASAFMEEYAEMNIPKRKAE